MDNEHHDRPVVVGVDGSAHALRAVRWAGAEAARRRTGLRLAAASGLVGDHLPGRAGRRRAVEEVLHEARAALPAGVVAVEVVVPGEPGPALVAQSHDAAVVVIGDRGAGRLEAALAGSVAAPLVRAATCPVVIVRGSVTDGLPVVVGVDATPASGVAAAFALRAAAARGVPLVAVHAEAEGAPVGARLQVLGRSHPQVPVRVVVTADDPGERLLAESHGAQLVVVGSRGFGELGGLVHGSVSAVLVHGAACPVAVVGPGVTSGGWSDAAVAGDRTRAPAIPGSRADGTPPV